MSRRVLVTAGAGGIGREIVSAFAATDAHVFACDIDAGALETLARDVPGVATAVCDIAQPAEVEAMVARAADTLGGIDILINNAGIAGPNAPVEALELDAWQQVVDVNLTGTFNVTRHAIVHLKRSAAASIVIMSSVAGRFGYRNRSPYAATKWGLIGLTKTLAIELGSYGIRVNAIMPGAVAGPRLSGVLAGRAQQSGESLDTVTAASLRSQSIKEFVDPRDVAALAVFITTDAGKMISGAMLPIDGDMQYT